ncbi:sorting nexin-31 isoform X2 [Microcaecilia unicolor]|uniref:Sorting nexin-31 n=1 Tax=Microcaecilia unicolor TaxID=1415580 RepID=A0A6P7Z9C8_9AMPH|nr:sorting nexin-31 isoform X2 [Microcaecilia unicolor]
MHFSIPITDLLVDSLGSRYVLYSVYLEGFLFCKVRYSQLHRWDEQLRRVFGSSVPLFPPKFYLAMTKSMAAERRLQLEHYLQKIAVDPQISNSEVFISFLKKLQLDTFRILTEKAGLDVYLPDGRNIAIDIETSDTVERVLEVLSYKLEIPRQLTGYFSLFVIQDCSNGNFSVLKRMVDFELPYVTLWSMKAEQCKIGIRKWYMNPSIDKMLMHCTAAVNLIYIQAVQEIERNWSKPTHGQMQKLELEKANNKIKFLELMQEVKHYGYLQLNPCTSDYPEPDCTAVVCVGNREISCCVTLPSNKVEEVSFNINRMRCWQVTFLGQNLEEQGHRKGQKLELKFEYSDLDSWRWITIYTEQAFLLSSCLQKSFSEQLMPAKEDLEMIEVPLVDTVKKSSKQQRKTNRNLQITTSRIMSENQISRNGKDEVFAQIREEDL